MSRVEEVDGNFGVRIEPMYLEPAALHAAVVMSAPRQPCVSRGKEAQSADHPGILNWLTVRPYDPATHGPGRTEFDVNNQALAVGLDVAGDEGVGVEPAATRLPPRNHVFVDLTEHIIVAGAQDDEI